MAFSASQLAISLQFDLTNSPKDFSLTDLTNYSGVTKTNVLGNLLAVDPDGLQFHNNVSYVSPDINYNSSSSSAVLGSLPLTSGAVKQGLYTFTYTAKIVGELQSWTIVSNNSAAKTFVITGDYASQILDASATNFKCVDNTTTNLTIVSAVYNGFTNETTVTVGQTLGTLTALAQFQYNVDIVYSSTFTQNYSYATPSICLNWVTDECCSSMTITDVTAYPAGATLDRLHTISYPVGIVPAPADIESPLQTVTINPIWTGTWTDVFTVGIGATNGIIEITDSVTSVKEHLVSSDEGLCQVYGCLTNMATKYAAYLTTAPQKAIEMSKYISQASAAYMAYTVGKQCGKPDYEQYLTIISDIANTCGCGCDCADCTTSGPQQVVGCCENVGGSDYEILMTSNGHTITITSSTVGTTTTFNIEVNGTWLTTQVNTIIAATSINALNDVNTGNIAAANGQTLIWNQGLGQWQRGTVQLNLVNLLDVNTAGLADQKVLYYDAATSTFKFKLIASPSIANCTDVTLTSLANGQILKYNGTAWVNVNNYLSLLGDVNVTGLANGKSLKWDSGTSKWIVYTPPTSLATLSDVSLTLPVNNADRFHYVTGLGWTNSVMPTFQNVPSGNFASGFAGSLAGYYTIAYKFDDITNNIELRGVVANTVGIPTGSPTILFTLPGGYWPSATISFTTVVGIGSLMYTGFGTIDTLGRVIMQNYYDSTGNIQTGIPIGGVSVDNITFQY
jgi:hypothetical protein